MRNAKCKHIIQSVTLTLQVNKDVNTGFRNVQCKTLAYEYPGLIVNPDKFRAVLNVKQREIFSFRNCFLRTATNG